MLGCGRSFPPRRGRRPYRHQLRQLLASSAVGRVDLTTTREAGAARQYRCQPARVSPRRRRLLDSRDARLHGIGYNPGDDKRRRGLSLADRLGYPSLPFVASDFAS
jgi:hypothetical protein